MIFENLKRLDAYPPGDCVKVGDTVSDIEEGKNAGLLTIAVVDSSSHAALAGPEEARKLLSAAGAGMLIGTVAELDRILHS
jgi:phosphonoacetaldehyde hydrolase